MSLLKSLARSLTQQVSGRRTWTPAEVRELIDRKQLEEALEASRQLVPGLEQRAAVQACLAGEVLFQQRDDVGAMSAFREALRLAPGLPSAHYGLSLLMAESGDLEDALRHAFFADSVQPNEPRFLAQLGYCQLQLKNFSLAEGPLRRASVRMDSNAYVWNNLGLVLATKGELQEAEDCLNRALKLKPDLASASRNLSEVRAALQVMQTIGSAKGGDPLLQVGDTASIAHDGRLTAIHAMEREGQLQLAIDACERLVLDSPDDAALVIELGRLYVRAGDPASAIDSLQAFRSRHPDDADVAASLGQLRLSMRDFQRAEGLLRQAAEADPDDVDRTLGVVASLRGQTRFREAGDWCRKALALAPTSQAVRMAYVLNLIGECRYMEALAACESYKSEGRPIGSLGVVLAFLGRFEEALEALGESVSRSPNDPHLRFHLSNVQLLLFDFERGWDDYKYRSFDNSEGFRVLPFPLWKGELLTGKRVLVIAEQGVGDQVMFASCLPDLLAMAPQELVVEAIDRIAPTIQRSFPSVRVVPTRQDRALDWLKDHEPFDHYVPIGDLPSHFRRTLSSFPQHNGYLKPDAGRVAYWRQRLAASGPGPYLGFSWKGGTESTRTALRTVDALAFAPLAGARPATWVVLQYGPVSEQVSQAAQAGFRALYWPEAIADLDEFAALVGALDLVVSVCNTTVHYAGAIGRPIWVLAPKIPEWRYGAYAATMPWYPSSRVFRQHEAGDWQGVFEEVRQELSTWTPP